MHWTYAEFQNEDDLKQGDILAPTQELRAVLSEVHPHFCAEKYLGFVITTQSCDLVRRKNGTVKARYVGIAVVRSLKEVLPRLFAEIVPPVTPGAFRASTKLTAKRLLERLFNQNEQSLGLFYLHADADVGLGESSVVFLRVSVALRVQHYDVICRARTGRLESEFRAKFGWLVGNLYSRAASPDWSDREGGRKQLQSLIEKHLQEQIPGAGPVWIPDELVEAGKNAGVSFEERAHPELLAELEKYRPIPRIDQLVEQTLKEVSGTLTLDNDQLRKLKNRLLNSGPLCKLLK